MCWIFQNQTFLWLIFLFFFFFQNFSMICALTHPALPLVENSCALVENIEDAWEELPFLNNFVMASYWFKVTAGLSLDDAFFFTSINSKRIKKKKKKPYVMFQKTMLHQDILLHEASTQKLEIHLQRIGRRMVCCCCCFKCKPKIESCVHWITTTSFCRSVLFIEWMDLCVCYMWCFINDEKLWNCI